MSKHRPIKYSEYISKYKYTPGPWSIDPPTERKPMERDCRAIREGVDGYLIATVWKDDTPGLMEGDAKLICAAPDLLEACRAALSELPAGSEAHRLVSAAIAKAIG
jgi:hypothetical protein